VEKIVGKDNGERAPTMSIDQQMQLPFEISFDLNKKLINFLTMCSSQVNFLFRGL